MNVRYSTAQKCFDNRAQSTFEYILAVSAVIVVLIVFLNPQGPFRNVVENSLNKTVDQINAMTDSFNF